MLQFYEVLAALNTTQLLLLIVLIVVLMALIPLMPLILKVIRLMRSKEEAEIIYFDLLFAATALQTQNEDGTTENHRLGSDPEYIISGSKATLVWQVKAVTRLDISPLGKSLKGNAADVIISPTNRTFVLTAHGLKGSISQTIEVPLEMIKTLEIENISENQSLSEMESEVHTTKLEPFFKGINPKNESYKALKHTKLSKMAKKDSIMMKINYSTTKYNSINSGKNKF